MAIRILHLSDLHLGPDWIPRAILSGRGWRRPVAPTLTEGLKQAIREARPDYIVLSGDFVNKARDGTFEEAAHYVREVLTDAYFDFQNRLLVVPGNHDVAFFPRPHSDDVQRLKKYRRFLAALFGKDHTENHAFHFIHIDPQLGLIFACLDSTLRNQRPIAEGEIGEGQLAWLKKEMAKARTQLADKYDRYVKIAVFHHHCLPIRGTPAKKERFMQLLDAGGLLDVLDEAEFQVALHGHKHVPHQQARYRSDSSVLTILGAGTATSVYVEEQEGFGNNFNAITIDAEGGLLDVELRQAGRDGVFRSVLSRAFPLFRVEPLGYRVDALSSVSTLESSGKLTERVVKSKLRVAKSGVQVNTLDFRLATSAKNARILTVVPDTHDATLDYRVKEDHLYEGTWKLNRTLSFGSPPIDVAYSYAIDHGTAMSVGEYQQMYPPGEPEESTSLIIRDPVGKLRIEVNFPTLPERFPAKPEVRVIHRGAVVANNGLKMAFQHDPDLNRCTLEMTDPPLNHEISIVWSLPETWRN